MSDPESQGEPSMEEILASIRRIISDEEEEGGAGGDGDTAASDDADPIELTQELKEDGSVVDLSAAEPNQEEDRGEADPSLETASEKMADDKKAQGQSGKSGEDIELVESDEVEEAEAPAPEEEADDEGLLSDSAASAAMASMSEVMAAAKTTTAPPSIGDGRTLEDLAREMIAPELKTWLDQNLAPLVERVVREEIKKMVRRVEDR
jgi:cell pole-organizing protein PopZ